MRRFAFAALLLAVASPLFAIRVLTLEPRGAAGDVPAPIHIKSNDGEVKFDATAQVFIDRQPAKLVSVVNPWELVALAPPHRPGWVDIWVVQDGKAWDATTLFGYGMSEEVFIPIAGDSMPGARGTSWTTEIIVYNDADHDVPVDAVNCSLIGSYFPCPGPITTVPAHASVRLTGRGTAQYPYAELYPPVQDVDSLHFSVHVRETSNPNGETIEIPALRRRDLRQGRIVLPGISTAERYRATLRLYSSAGHIAIRISDAVTAELLDARSLERPIPTDGDSFALLAFQDLFATAKTRSHERVNVVIETDPNDLHWALLTLTDNDTAQVLTFTPQ